MRLAARDLAIFARDVRPGRAGIGRGLIRSAEVPTLPDNPWRRHGYPVNSEQVNLSSTAENRCRRPSQYRGTQVGFGPEYFEISSKRSCPSDSCAA